jgi:RNA polymerase sigma-70 factor (ECF subfamily)
MDDMADFSVCLARAQAGEEEAFACLWRAYQPALVRHLRVLAGPLAEDLAADVWLQVIRSLSRFSGDERGFRAWLHTMARNAYFDAWRRRQRRPEILPVEPIERPSADDPVLAAETGFSTAAALDLIARLPPDQADAVTLRLIADLDVGQVAEMMGRSPGAVRVLTHRGLRRLAAMLNNREAWQLLGERL